MNRKKSNRLPLLVLGCVVAVLAGCDHSPETTTTATTAETATASAPNGAKLRLVAVAPSDAELAKMHLSYATFKAAPDGSYIEFVPLPPKSGDVIVGIHAPGTYVAKLMDSKCAFDVRVTPSEGAPFVLNTAAPSHQFTLAKPGQLKSVMGDNAANNYSCNVSLEPR